MKRRHAQVLAAAGAVAVGLLSLAPAPAQAATANCVAVIVDKGSGVSSRCMKWRSGLTGAGALTGTGHSYRLAPSGLICSIDGFPADCHVDSTHFWSYWHKAPGSGTWTFSSEGAGTYNPRSGETEGWAYQNGSSRKPRNIAFNTICPPPKPPATPGLPPPAPGTTTTAPGGRSPASAVPGRTAAGAAPGGTSNASTAPATPAPAASTSAAAAAAAAATRKAGQASRSTGAPVTPVLLTGLGLVAAAGLGAAAWRRTRKAG